MRLEDLELFEAVKNDQLERARAAIDNGADVNARSLFRDTPLHVAARNNHIAIAELLLEKGADVNARNHNHSTPLHDAALVGRSEIVQQLIEHGANVTARNIYRRVPFDLVPSKNSELGDLLQDAANEQAKLGTRVKERGDDASRQQASHAGRVSQDRDNVEDTGGRRPMRG